MEKSYVSADDICESQYSVARPIKLPSAVVGYIADLIKALAEQKIKHIQN
jgi:hypothetical protein